MGFFSQDCERCGRPLLSIWAIEEPEVAGWMAEAVALTPSGSIHVGEYDGHGGIDGAAYAVGDSTVWHRACWELAGKPTEFTGASRASSDQGWFFDTGDHTLPDPRLSGAPDREDES